MRFLICLIFLQELVVAQSAENRSGKEANPELVNLNGLNNRPAPGSFKLDRMSYKMRFMMEDGTQPPKEMVAKARGGCVVQTQFSSGILLLQPPVIPTDEPCLIGLSAPGIRSWNGGFREDGLILLRRLGPAEGSTISMRVLSAPAEAKRAYAKGEEALLKKKLPEAEKQFEAALRSYPEHAAAWSELGRLFEMRGETARARGAYEKAIEMDAKYIKPRVQLAGLEAGAGNWEAVARAADGAIALHAIEFPGAYYYRGLAHLYVGRASVAAELLAQAVELDARGELAGAAVFLAMAHQKSGNRAKAIGVLERYLETRVAGVERERAELQLRQLRLNP